MTTKNTLSLQEHNRQNSSLVYKGGKLIIQEDGQKGLENTYLNFFMETEAWKEWCDKNKATKIIPGESPDFVFETSNGKNIGLEITNLIVKTKWRRATAALQNIANQVCQHFKKEKGIALSIIIDIYDERKFSARSQDIISYRYDPGFKRLDASKKDIKNAVIKVLSEEVIKPWDVTKKWIKIGFQMFVVTADRMNESYTSAHVNNSGICTEDPFEELQNTINAKNTKYEIYKSKCDECDLLVVFDDSTGNYAFFTHKISSYEFVSLFRNVYLLNLGNRTSTKLRTKPIPA